MRPGRAHPLPKIRRLALDNKIKLSPSQIKYIICLCRLSESGYGVKNVEIAAALGVSKPSVHNMLKSLAALGLVSCEVFGRAFFTEKGRLLARKYALCYLVLEKKLSEMCGNGAASENAICVLLADMPSEKLCELYDEWTGQKE